MRRSLVLLGIAAAEAVLCLAGCATNRGGAEDTYYSGSTTTTSSGVTAPPTMRPGMNPQDVRDPNFLNNQQPPWRTTP